MCLAHNAKCFLSHAGPLSTPTMADADKQAGSKAAPASETVVTEKPHDYDSENHSAELNPQERTLKRQLKNRHVAMIRYALRIS